MRPTTPIVVTVTCAALGLGIAAASAQSGDIVFLDEIPPVQADAGAETDAAQATDTGTDAGQSSGVIIEGISDGLPETPIADAPRMNPREAFTERVIAHAKGCIQRHAVDQSSVDVGFLYLVREGRPNATLSAVTNDDGLHLPRFYVDVTRAVGETKPLDVEAQRRIFVECLQVVPLPTAATVSERLSFRIKRTALALKPRDVEWQPL